MTGAQYLMTGAKCEYFWCPVYNTYYAVGTGVATALKVHRINFKTLQDNISVNKVGTDKLILSFDSL